jgi:hypothetical protein
VTKVGAAAVGAAAGVLPGRGWTGARVVRAPPGATAREHDAAGAVVAAAAGGARGAAVLAGVGAGAV